MKTTIPLAVVLGLSVGAIDPVRAAIAGAPFAGPEGWGDKLLRHYTGFTPSRAYYGRAWEPRFLAFGAAPAIGGLILHKLANRLGVNRALRSVPLLRI